jgi:hypothetical protein
MNSIAKPELVAEATIAPQNESWERLFASTVFAKVVGATLELNALMDPDEPVPEDTAMNEVVLSVILVGLRVVWLVGTMNILCVPPAATVNSTKLLADGVELTAVILKPIWETAPDSEGCDTPMNV